MGALDGVAVADLTIGLAGPLAGMMLADHGADVVKVEPVDGDPYRDQPGWEVWSRNKTVVTLDPSEEAGRRQLAQLVEAADIVLVGGDTRAITFGDLRQLGIRRTAGSAWVVVVPYLLDDAAWIGGCESAGMVFAQMGHAWVQASAADVPVDCVYPVVPCIQGVWSATVAVAAITPSGGQGGIFTVGGAHAAVLASPGNFTIRSGEPHVHRPGGAGGALPNYRCYRCKDGEWIFFGAFTAAFARRGFEALGIGWLLSDPRLHADIEAMRDPANFDWLATAIGTAIASRDQAECLALLEAEDVPVAPVSAPGRWLDHPQVVALGLRAEVAGVDGSQWVMPGIPVALSRTPGSIRGLATSSHAPSAGQPPDRPRPPDRGTTQPPLAGTTVIDLGTIIAGPYIATLLASLGADVVKVERPPYGDEYRIAHGGRGGVSFPAYNRGQRSVALDLTTSGGRLVMTRLLGGADIVVDNYRPGVAARLGLDGPTLELNNPGVISVSVSAFGTVGPSGNRPGFDPVIQAISGIMREQGGPDPADSPAFLTIPATDVVAATLGAFGACAGIFARPRLGQGQHVEVTLTAAATLLQAELLATKGRSCPGLGTKDFPGPNAISRLYPVRDGWVRLDGRWPEDSQRLAAWGILSVPLPPEADVVKALAEFLSALTADEAIAALADAGVPAARARQASEVAGDLILQREGVLQAVRSEAGDPGVAAGQPHTRLDRPDPPLGPSPQFGQHTKSVLEQLGFSDDEIAELHRSGAVAGPID